MDGHGHGGSHSGKALGQGGGCPPPKPASLWSWWTQDLWAFLVHLYHLWRWAQDGQQHRQQHKSMEEAQEREHRQRRKEVPYNEVKVGTSKHEQTQQCGDGPVSHRGKCVLKGTGGPQVPAALGGQKALGK